MSEQTSGPVFVDSQRWRPSRAGLVNVWQYTNEVLEFERGRMVLYGPNGSGKTMALELLLPHLLDAKAQPARLSTSGLDRGGLWDRVTGYDTGEARTGFLWVEFERASGETFTIGARLRAKPSGGGDKYWFTTFRRIDVEFSLLDEHRRPLKPDALEQLVGARGKVWGKDTAGYRRAVRNTLFRGWTEERLDALIRTLLVVRKQNVSDGLSSSQLSKLLSEALAPVDERELGRVADGFADLDRRGDHIERLHGEIATTQALVKVHREYARAVVARGTSEFISAQTAFDGSQRAAKKLGERLEECESQLQALADRDRDLDAKTAALSGQLEGLRSSDAYRHGAELDNLRQAAQGATELAKEARELATAKRGAASSQWEVAREARAKHAGAVRALERARGALETALAKLGAPPWTDMADGGLIPSARAWLKQRGRAIEEVREGIEALELESKLCQAAKAHKLERERALGDVEGERDELVGSFEDALQRWRDAVSGWITTARELGPHLADTLLDDPKLASERIAAARSRAREPLISKRAEISGSVQDLERTLEELREDLQQWRMGRDPAPEVPRGRRDRYHLEGAPVWRLLRFRDVVEDATRERIESALLDCGLLDAWVDAAGEINLAEGDADIVASLAGSPARAHDRTLAAVLEPDPASTDVPAPLVLRLLEAIALVDADAHLQPGAGPNLVIGEDGTWRTSDLVGRASPGAARHIGAASRASYRRSKIAALERELEDGEASLRALQDQLAALARRLTRCDEEADELPPTDEVEEAQRKLVRAEGQIEQARKALHEAVDTQRAADKKVTQAKAKLQRVADQHALPTTRAKLAKVGGRLERAESKIEDLSDKRRLADDGDGKATREERAAEDAEADAADAERRANDREDERERAVHKHQAVEDAIGTDYRYVIETIATIESEQRGLRSAKKQVLDEQRSLLVEKGGIESDQKAARERRAAAEQDRERRHHQFVSMCRDDLVREAEVDIVPADGDLASLTAALKLARRVNATKACRDEVGEARLNRLNNRVIDKLSEASRKLAGRVDFDRTEPEDRAWMVLRARRDGISTSARSLLAGLREDLDVAEAELSAKQQELFEEILSGSVREHLKQRLWSAQELVDRINGLLENVQTAAGGVRVELGWEIDPNLADAVELKKAKQLFLHDSPVAEGRTELDAFLRARIDQVRAEEGDTGEWRDRLARTLDYRAWHRFRVFVHHHRFGDRPRPLDSRKVSLSAGEKTIVMVLPLLVAVTAHYEPAPNDPPCSCPRLLLMDELFPKLDFPNKRLLMGLLPTLDLDAVFTSDKDRCMYDTLDGIAILLFQKLANDKTTTTRMVWNGSELETARPPAAGAA